MTDDRSPPEKKGIDRRSLLIGGAAGAVAGAAITGAAGAGLMALQSTRRKFLTPGAVPEGAPAEIAESFADSRPAFATAMQAPAGAPNIVVVVLDDVGFADFGCYGSEIATPNFDAVAQAGLRYTNFRTCAMCSPTRASLLTGLNHHSAGMGWLADVDGGYPGYRGDLTQEAATLAEVLRDAGWSTLQIGKWHVSLAHGNGANGPTHNWPTNRGFERAYWYQGHSIDFFRPADLFDGVAPVEPPQTDDYYATDDLTDRAIQYVRTQKTLDPDKPFLLYVGYPTTHSPLQAKAEDRDAYKGRYDAGWDVVRAARLARQQEMGLVPETTELPPLSFGANAWDTLSATEKRLYARYMEVYAGMLTALDRSFGRLLACLDDLGIRDNTLIVVLSDNGASGEGTPTGTPNVFAPAFGRPVPVEEAAKLYDVMGEDQTFPHYPQGWACVSNTPFRLYKQYAHLGGVADPLIVSWPARIADRGALRTNYVHVVDLYPTLLEAAGVARPDSYRGRRLKPVEGASVAGTFADPAAPTREEQYYELGGQRAFQSGKWRAVVRHERGSDFANDQWELYDTQADPNEMNDLAAVHPDILASLIAKWEEAAQRYNVYPLDDRNLVIKMVEDRRRRGIRPNWVIRPPIERLAREVAPLVTGFSHEIEIDLERGAGDNGVLVAHGSKHAGYVIHIHEGRLYYETSLVPWREQIISPDPLPEGRLTLRYRQTMTSRPFDGSGALFLGDVLLAERVFDRVLFATSYDGFSVGADLGNQVSDLYPSHNPFRGRIIEVRINVDTAPFTMMEQMRFIDSMGLRI